MCRFYSLFLLSFFLGGEVLADLRALSGLGAPFDELNRAESWIADRNEQSQEQIRSFLREGWTTVEQAVWERTQGAQREAPPAWTLHRLATTALSRSQLDPVASVAQQTKDSKLRELAVEALARSRELHAQELLIELYRQSQDGAEKSRILSALWPRGREDPVREFLQGEVSDSQLSTELRTQAAISLIWFDPQMKGRTPASTSSFDRELERIQLMIWGDSR